LTDLEYQIYIIESRRPHLQAAGLWSDSYDAMQTYVLWGVVMDDPEVLRLTLLPDFKIIDDPEEMLCAFTTDWARLFASMGPAGRAALKERIKNRAAKR
jgi:hypothetical protein